MINVVQEKQYKISKRKHKIESKKQKVRHNKQKVKIEIENKIIGNAKWKVKNKQQIRLLRSTNKNKKSSSFFFECL